MFVVVNNPIDGMLGMDLGTPVVKCQNCGQMTKLIELGTLEKSVDLHAFPSIMTIIEQSRRKYAATHSVASQSTTRTPGRRGRS